MYAFVVAHQGLLLNILFVTGAICFLLGEGFLGRLAGLNPALARKDTISAGVLIGITSALFLGGSFYALDRFSDGAYNESVRAALHWSDLSPVALAVGYGMLAGFLPMLLRGVVRTVSGDRLDAMMEARGDEALRAASSYRGGYFLLFLLPLVWAPGNFVSLALTDHVRVLLGWLGGREAPIWLLALIAYLLGFCRILAQGISRVLSGGYTTKEERAAYRQEWLEEALGTFMTLNSLLLATGLVLMFAGLVILAALGYLAWLSGFLFVAIIAGTYLVGFLHTRLVRWITRAPPHVLFVVFSIGSGLTVFLGRYVVDPGLLPTFLR